MSLGSALFSPAQSRLMEWIFGQPARWFHIQELLRLTGLGSASLQREIKRLHEAGLVSEERIGNLRRVSANPESPVFAELVSLVSKTAGLVPAISEALSPLTSRLKAALVFGSVASGQDKAGSDVDLLLVSDSVTLNDALTLLLPLESRLGRRIDVKLYKVASFKTRRQETGSVLQRVLAQPYTLLLGSIE